MPWVENFSLFNRQLRRGQSELSVLMATTTSFFRASLVLCYFTEAPATLWGQHYYHMTLRPWEVADDSTFLLGLLQQLGVMYLKSLVHSTYFISLLLPTEFPRANTGTVPWLLNKEPSSSCSEYGSFSLYALHKAAWGSLGWNLGLQWVCLWGLSHLSECSAVVLSFRIYPSPA